MTTLNNVYDIEGSLRGLEINPSDKELSEQSSGGMYLHTDHHGTAPQDALQC